MGILAIKISNPTSRELIFQEQKERKIDSKFMKEFKHLCKRYGFDPSVKETSLEWDYVGDGKNEWHPKTGKLSHSVGKDAYIFFRRYKGHQLTSMRINAQNLRFSKKVKVERRQRLPEGIAESIVYILEKVKGDRIAIESLRIFFMGEEFERIVLVIEEQIRAKVALDRIILKYRNTVETPPFIKKLRYGKDSKNTLWANHMKLHLLRRLLSEKGASIEKSIGVRKKAKKMKEILAKGDQTLNDL